MYNQIAHWVAHNGGVINMENCIGVFHTCSELQDFT